MHMNLVRKILGPKSKYEKDLPYAYEARVSLTGDSEVTATYLADTICGLVEYLQAEAVDPATVEILEVHQGRDVVLDRKLYLERGSEWLTRPALCKSFETHYPGHIRVDDCTFGDRDEGIAGR
jgi:hypothetical protein